MKTIAMTGASGAMGTETVKSIMHSKYNFKIKALLLHTDKYYATKLKRKYGHRIEIIFGDIRNKDDCKALVKNADYVLHLAALIPPKADRDADTTIAVNYGGTKNIVDCISKLEIKPKLIHISTVAIYGHRNFLHPWGRVGDPLLPSVFDVYATSKLKAERYVLESGLKDFAVLRQTGILYNDLLINNISDGLMFHTPWNVPIEWVTARDSARLMVNILEKDVENAIPFFWKKVYNIGGGADCRETGYDIFDKGFKIIGGSVEKFFEPSWNPNRNFHCFWFSDSEILNELFDFQRESTNQFWQTFRKSHRLYEIAKILPPVLIRKLIIEPLLKDKNAPSYWIKAKEEARVIAAFGAKENINALDRWEAFPLIRNGKTAFGDFDYINVKNNVDFHKLNHGYDESKPDEELGIEDMRQVATYRGGKCLSASMKKGDLFTPLKWCCHLGHEFYASPYTILKAGHWCEKCISLTKWDFDLSVPYVPFYQQVWYDSHAKGEKYIYYLKNGSFFLKKEVA